VAGAHADSTDRLSENPKLRSLHQLKDWCKDQAPVGCHQERFWHFCTFYQLVGTPFALVVGEVLQSCASEFRAGVERPFAASLSSDGDYERQVVIRLPIVVLEQRRIG
jgi:hypothetical protein